MTPISDYYYDRSSFPCQTTCFMDIWDSNSYAFYQVYLNNVLNTVSSAKQFSLQIQINDKVDILGVDTLNQYTDYSNTLDDTHGDRVEFLVDQSYIGYPACIYYDNQTGIINYGRPLGCIDIPNNCDGFSNGFNDGFGCSAVVVYFTPRLESGSYLFALVNTTSGDYYHNPIIVSKTIGTRPNETFPDVIHYEPGTDTITLAPS